MKLSKQAFLITQPGYPDVSRADDYYYEVAKRLLNSLEGTQVQQVCGEEHCRQLALTVVGYFQDVVADAGIFRSFCTLCNELYNKTIPLFEEQIGEDYIDSELNLTDVKFITWYFLESISSEKGTLAPRHSAVEEAAAAMYKVLDECYEDAPVHDDYLALREIDFDNPDAEMVHDIYDTTYWLFWNSYFMRHAAKPTIAMALAEGKKVLGTVGDNDRAAALVDEINHRTLEEYPTGPLSLYAHEWIRQIVDGVSPFKKRKKSVAEPHHFYTEFLEATGGKNIAFCPTFDDLDHFLSEKMKWGKTEEGHFPQFKEFGNFVLYVTPEKGMLIAPEVAQYVVHPDNPCYNKKEAKAEAHELITMQGRCPIDLVKHLFANGMVPDAALPWDDSRRALLDNWDFLARFYLQSFYRAK